jgi:hypothetical protein
MNWSNKKVWLVLAGIIVLVFAVILVLMVSGPFVPVQMCTLVGCIGGIDIKVIGLPESIPFEVSLKFPSGETQTVKCGGETDESIPFETSCPPDGAFFSLPPDVKPPQEITATVTTSDGQWTETVQPEYEKFQPNGDDCPPICYTADIVIWIGP